MFKIFQIKYQNLWDTAKTMLIGKFMAWNNYAKTEERSKINNVFT